MNLKHFAPVLVVFLMLAGCQSGPSGEIKTGRWPSGGGLPV